MVKAPGRPTFQCFESPTVLGLEPIPPEQTLPALINLIAARLTAHPERPPSRTAASSINLAAAAA